MSDIQEFLTGASDALRPVLQAAFDAGREAGKRDAAAEFKVRLAAMLDEPAKAVAEVPVKDSRPPTHSGTPAPKKPRKGRAAPGTVKPKILKVVQRHGADGVRTRDIAAETGFKYNSVRGTLWLLKKEGDVRHHNELWFPVFQGSVSAPSGAANE